MLTSLMIDEEGPVLARNREARRGWKMKGSPKQSSCYVLHVYVCPIRMTTSWLMRTNMRRWTVYGIWPENKDWSKQQEQVSPTAVADNWSRTEVMPLISLRKSYAARGQNMRCDISRQRLQPIWKKRILGYFLHAHWTEAQLHTPVPWLATKLHCRQTKLVNRKEAKKKWVSEWVLVLASSVS